MIPGQFSTSKLAHGQRYDRSLGTWWLRPGSPSSRQRRPSVAMRRRLIAGLVCITACVGSSPEPPAVTRPPAPGVVRSWPGDSPGGRLPSNFTLTMERRGGEGVDRKLEVRFISPGRADGSVGVDRAGARITGALTTAEATGLVNLTERSELDQGGHIGFWSGETGMRSLDTLMFWNAETGRTVVLVTGGNKNFSEDPNRRALLQQLKAVQSRLITEHWRHNKPR
jgi:hypothetical protein